MSIEAAVANQNSLNPTKLIATIDMGANSFKLLLVRALPNGRFLSLHRIKDPVLLGRSRNNNNNNDDNDNDCNNGINCNSNSNSISNSIPLQSQLRVVSSLRRFSDILRLRRYPSPVVVATSALRSASNAPLLLSLIHRELPDLRVHVISGDREARLVYLAVLQFLPVFSRTVLAVDIGGGSTEFVVGLRGSVLFSTSLQLGHISLTDTFLGSSPDAITNMRAHIRNVISDSQLTRKVREFGFDIAAGCSGTIRSIEHAIFVGSGSGFGRGWRFSREELGGIVERLLGGEDARSVGFSKRRAEFVIAGAVLLWEIFEALGIQEMEVSEYALGEGVAAEVLGRECEDFDVNANARWRSVVRLASRFNGEKKMKANLECASLAKEIADGLKKCEERTDDRNKYMDSLNYKDLEYLEAAILLHSVGLVMGKKGYHKQSYYIIKNGNHLYSYSDEEIELIALLARYHRKSFPKCENDLLRRLSMEMKQKFRVLCAIMRICLALHHCQCMTIQGLDIKHSPEGFELVLSQLKDDTLPSEGVQPVPTNIETELKRELEHFKEVFHQGLSIVVPSIV